MLLSLLRYPFAARIADVAPESAKPIQTEGSMPSHSYLRASKQLASKRIANADIVINLAACFTGVTSRSYYQLTPSVAAVCGFGSLGD
jgi:hypothetical protein